MPDSIDDLARRWRVQPDGPATLALCDRLRMTPPELRRELVDEVAKLTAELYASNAPVLLAVAHLYADDGRLIDAYRLLVVAQRLMPYDPGIARLSGEVLLRRGDADHAEAMLRNAMKLGANDSGTAEWLDRAAALKTLQATAGAHAVAVEVKGTAVVTAMAELPVATPPVAAPPVAPPPRWHHVVSIDDEGATVVRARPALETDEGTQVSALPGRIVQPAATIELEAVDAFAMAEKAGSPMQPAVAPSAFGPNNPGPAQGQSQSAGGTLVLAMDPRRLGSVSVASSPEAASYGPVSPVPATQASGPAGVIAASGAQTPYLPSPGVGPYVGAGAPPFVAAPAGVPAPVYPGAPNPSGGKKRGRKGLVVGIVVVVLLLAGGVVAATQFLPGTFQSAPQRSGKRVRH